MRDTTVLATLDHQIRMMGDINRLTADTEGQLALSDYLRTVGILLLSGSDPVISRHPEVAFNYAGHRRGRDPAALTTRTDASTDRSRSLSARQMMQCSVDAVLARLPHTGWTHA